MKPVRIRRHLRRRVYAPTWTTQGFRVKSRVRSTLPKQAWCPRGFIVGEFLELEHQGLAYGTGFKPQNAIWTSTWTKDKSYMSEWHERMRDIAGFEQPQTEECFVLVPRKNLRIYEIDNRDNLVWLVNNYSLDGVPLERRTEGTLDWGKITKDFDAVHLTKRGQLATLSGIPNLWGWDVESTAWLRPAKTFEAYIGGIDR